MSWKKEHKEEARRDYDESIESLKKTLDRDVLLLKEALDVKVRVIEALKTEPNFIWGSVGIVISTDDTLVVHELADAFGVQFKRDIRDNGSFVFDAMIDNVSIHIIGIKTVHGCEVEWVEETKVVRVPKVKCQDQ